jgi:hypothetical protein
VGYGRSWMPAHPRQHAPSVCAQSSALMIQLGCRVTNHSYTVGVNAALSHKFDETRTAGLIHFAAAGNCFPSCGGPPIGYPANLSSVNGVSALDYATNGLAGFSRYGIGLDFSAPGRIRTTDRTGNDGAIANFATQGCNDYTWSNGTSFGRPLAAGVAALILSTHPSLAPCEVERIMRQSAVDLGASGAAERQKRFSRRDCPGDRLPRYLAAPLACRRMRFASARRPHRRGLDRRG